ncbi:DUF2268 domain-containing putative Zn-dependent protease [Halobacillus ihumii]|uniref:DUF2268 domain-containing putative Zn-dependent protease n=1 Tax=Halobacillus ihumii TaxID=2686092 RepID=UPI0013D0269D|nr:DUF2268 domain-containing putative Zn-dependent protease [Halobacillus ihumii]
MRYLVISGLALLSILIGYEEANQKIENNNQVDASEQAKNYSANEEYIIEATTKSGQALRVFSVYEYVDQYVKKAEETEDVSERYKLWQDIVIDHIQESCLSGVYSHLVKEYVNTPPKELEKVKNDIAMLRASESEEAALQALKKSAYALPGTDTTVCLLPNGNVDYAGVNVGEGKISVFSFPYFSEDRLKQTVAHEYHHSTWTAKFSQNYEWDMLGSINFEGKAEYFSSLLYGPPYIETFSNMGSKKERNLWNRVKDSLDTTDKNHVGSVLYGDGKEFPYNFGYIAGYHIVHEYAKNHPQATIEKWTKLSPEELYEQSGYEESLK